MTFDELMDLLAAPTPVSGLRASVGPGQAVVWRRRLRSGNWVGLAAVLTTHGNAPATPAGVVQDAEDLSGLLASLGSGSTPPAETSTVEEPATPSPLPPASTEETPPLAPPVEEDLEVDAEEMVNVIDALRARAARSPGGPQWASDVRRLVLDVSEVTGDRILLRLAATSPLFFGRIARESNGLASAANLREPPATPGGPNRGSYGRFQILDTTARRLWDRRDVLLGSLSAGMSRPPAPPDAGNPEWRRVLTGASGDFYGLAFLRAFTLWFSQNFDAEAAVIEGLIVGLPGDPEGAEIARRLRSMNTHGDDLGAVMLAWYGASSSQGVLNRVGTPDFQRKLDLAATAASSRGISP